MRHFMVLLLIVSASQAIGQHPNHVPSFYPSLTVPKIASAPIHAWTQEQLPASQAPVIPRTAPSFHPVTQAPVHFAQAPPPPSVQVAPFCPPTVNLATFVPAPVTTFHLPTPSPQWMAAPPPPGVQLAFPVEPPPRYGLPFQRPNVSLIHRPQPEAPIYSGHCLPR
ncbi:MAG: hypothetical protein RMI91_14540 [Gemmatales bacterium]|nr:hypothetical protein [Gemmatales bacterium]MDW7995864.1 hypothetical protein [Gemmatales bacterium]